MRLPWIIATMLVFVAIIAMGTVGGATAAPGHCVADECFFYVYLDGKFLNGDPCPVAAENCKVIVKPKDSKQPGNPPKEFIEQCIKEKGGNADYCSGEPAAPNFDYQRDGKGNPWYIVGD